MTKVAEVTAIHEDDALALLARLGVAQAYEAGTLLCSACGAPLNTHELGAARRTAADEYVFSCGRLDCLDEFHAA